MLGAAIVDTLIITGAACWLSFFVVVGMIVFARIEMRYDHLPPSRRPLPKWLARKRPPASASAESNERALPLRRPGGRVA